VKIMPNPVQNTLSISLEEQTGFDFGGMRIFDVFGKEVYSIGNLEIKSAIDVSGLAPGVYFVKIEGENQSATSKFVKQ
ncbi:MAG TPA: T9SS type A sorting domain-containing protein, partial [Bacteroidales bacterium]|nr:T9SS type A sorting domain-containing protein [Bacteroidales bacterium]